MSDADTKQELVYINTVDKYGIESVAPVFHNEREVINSIIIQARRAILHDKAEKNLELSRIIRNQLTNKKK